MRAARDSGGGPDSSREAQAGEHQSRGIPRGPQTELPEPSCPVPYTWAVATKWRTLLEEDMVAGTGDQESPREHRPPPSHPGPRTWTRWPPCSLRALSRTQRRAGSVGWNRCDARFHSSILGAGSTLQSAVHFLFQRQRESVLAQGPRSSRGRSGQGAAARTRTSSHPALDRIPGPRGHRLACPGSASPCRPRVQPPLQDAPPCADFTLRLPRVGSGHLAFASLLPNLPTLPPPPERRITSGKV